MTDVTIHLCDLDEFEQELLQLYKSLDTDGKAQVMATAYKEHMRMMGKTPEDFGPSTEEIDNE